MLQASFLIIIIKKKEYKTYFLLILVNATILSNLPKKQDGCFQIESLAVSFGRICINSMTDLGQVTDSALRMGK